MSGLCLFRVVFIALLQAEASKLGFPASPAARGISTCPISDETASLSMLQIPDAAAIRKIRMQDETEGTAGSTGVETPRDSKLIQLGTNVTVVVARASSESLEWRRELMDLPFVIETESRHPRRQRRQNRFPGPSTRLQSEIEVEKPRTYKGDTTYECGGFLNFIVDQYAQLPEVSVFVHGNPLGENRHMHGDPQVLSAIRHIASDPGRVGYCSLNGESTWQTWPHDPHGGNGDRWKTLIQEMKSNTSRFGHLITTLGPFRYDTGMRTYDSGQFAVSHERIQRHTLAFYEELLDWLRDAPSTDDDSAHRCAMLEIFWHRIFGEASALPHPQGRCAVVYGLDQTELEGLRHSRHT